MMISRSTRYYDLQICKTSEDEFGYKVEAWETLRSIKVAINEKYLSVADGQGTVYQRRVIMGVTDFKNLSIQPKATLDGSFKLDGTTILIDECSKCRLVLNEKSRRLTTNNQVYLVEDFIVGRLTQLQLKEVV